MTLDTFFHAHPRRPSPFPAGRTRRFLLWAAKTYGCDVHAYYMKTAFQPAFELADAPAARRRAGHPHDGHRDGHLGRARRGGQRPDRCYHCKRQLFSALWQRARRDGHTLLLDGTNASDDEGDRPGMQALRELEVRSPLRSAGLTKDEVRRLSREAGLFTLGKTRLRVPGHPHPHRDPHHSGGPGAGGARGGRPFPPGVCRFPGAPAGGRRAHPGDGGADGAGPAKWEEILEQLKPDFTDVLLDQTPRQASR